VLDKIKLMKKNIIKKIITSLLMLPLLAMSFPVGAITLPQYNASGIYVVALEYQSTIYPHDMNLTQDGLGNLTGNGGSPAGANTYLWTITSGTVSGNSINITADYSATEDAVTPLTTMIMTGTIAQNGTMSGTWSDNYQGQVRAGTWSTTQGNATALGTLNAEDFGVMDASGVKGYTAGFGLTDATFTGATSVVVQLFSGTTLLQTNTAIIAKFNTDITGTQFSSPFDVSGTFDYVADGYWTNARQTEYGQNVSATRVVATVTLANGKIVTAENTNLTGDPATIFPPNQTSIVTNNATAITSTDAILNGTNGNASAIGHSFWVSLSPFVTTSPTIPAGVYSTPDLGAIGANTPFSASLLSVTTTGVPSNLPAITANTTYYFSAWSNVGGTWYPGEVLNFTTLESEGSNNGGEVGGEVTQGVGVLNVTSITTTKGTSTADGTFAGGWIYTFHVTTPTNESKLAMKFTDWTGSPSGTIPTANNVRISSAQADNLGATVLLTGAGIYSTPKLNIVSDLNPLVAGMQIDVIVEVSVPIGTPAAFYTSAYGVQTTP
jgi:hypothetical protein